MSFFFVLECVVVFVFVVIVVVSVVFVTILCLVEMESVIAEINLDCMAKILQQINTPDTFHIP